MRIQADELNKKVDEYFPYLEGQKFIGPENGKPYFIFKDLRDDRVEIVISSYLGYSAGATHYYGRVKYHPWRVSEEEDGKNTICGWLGGLKIETDMVIEVSRRLTREEVKTDPDRWQAWEEGNYTDCFKTLKSLGVAIKRLLVKHFPDKKYHFSHLPYEELTSLDEIISKTDSWRSEA